ncbi:MAG TPA: DUF4097 family beta strand repeat-containing protein [Vicinamibacteria bacterium]|nr:DUF4097 family beta strand repeat-containing protein [Vicinamibacteria bacterium]
MKRAWPVLCLLSGLALSGCVDGGFGTPFRESLEESRPLAANGEFTLENTNGTVRLAAWDEAKVRIEAEKHAASEHALRQLQVEIVGEGDRLSVRTRQPHLHFFGGSGRVDYRVSVPRGARVRVVNVNGRVEVDGVTAAVRARTVNGSVEVTGAAAEVEARAVNGSVEVSFARVDPAGRSELSSTNGSLRLTLPPDAGADVEARTVNGGVACDFDLAEARKSRRRIEGRIGTGGARFDLGTVNGSVHVDRGVAAAAARTPAEAPEKRPSR